MFNKIKDDFNHSYNCGITVKNTKLLEDNLFWLWYQLVECLECWKQYIVFRYNDNITLEPYNSDMENFILQVLNNIKLYDKFNIYIMSKWFLMISNIEEYINYPIGKEDDILIQTIIDKSWNLVLSNKYFNEINKEEY